MQKVAQELHARRGRGGGRDLGGVSKAALHFRCNRIGLGIGRGVARRGYRAGGRGGVVVMSAGVSGCGAEGSEVGGGEEGGEGGGGGGGAGVRGGGKADVGGVGEQREGGGGVIGMSLNAQRALLRKFRLQVYLKCLGA
jgi:hypothetical protein